MVFLTLICDVMKHNAMCPERRDKGRKLCAKHVNLQPIISGDVADGSFGC